MSSSLVYPPASSGGGAQNNFAATTYPTATNDSSQGYAAGSVWMVPTIGDTWRCRDATVGAAVWTRMDMADFFGYVPGNWYTPFGTAQFITGAVAGNSIRFLPWVNKERFTMNALGVRVTTAFSGGNVQSAIYAADPNSKRPTGTPLVTTPSMSTSTATTVSSAVSQAFEEGLYWIGTNMDNATAILAGASGLTGSQIVGTTTEANAAINYLHFFFTQTFGTFPDMTNNTLSEILAGTTSTIPLSHFRVGSLP